MSSRQTWFWLVLAASLFAFIFFFQRHRPRPTAGPRRVLPELQAAAVNTVQVRPGGPVAMEMIRAEKTGPTWQLTQPLAWPARATNINNLLTALEGLTAETCIPTAEMRNRPNAEEEYGFASPQASLVLQQADARTYLLVGALTVPGDQVFVKVVGREGIYVVNSDWLKCLPHSANDWRDPLLVTRDFHELDRLAVTNNAKAFVLQRDTNHLWRMTWPLNSARADNVRIEESLKKLEGIRIKQFVADDAKTDWESFGLVTPALEISLGQGTNLPTVLQFGKNSTGETNQVYARRLGQNSVFTVDNGLLAVWRGASVDDFRDPHLLTLSDPIASIEVHGEETFSLERQGDDTWRVRPADFPADRGTVKDLLASLASLPIIQFAKAVVTAPDLPQFGLAAPVRQYLLKGAVTNAAGLGTNCVLVELSFGVTTNQPDKVFALRADESSVYAISTNDFARLPSQSLQFRERRLWPLSENDVARLTIRQEGKFRELIRNGPHQWSFATNSSGVINDLAVEETVRGLTRVSADAWVAREEQNPERFGLGTNAYHITLLLTNGAEASLALGNEAPSNDRYASVNLDGQLWIFEFPWNLYQDVASYLSIP